MKELRDNVLLFDSECPLCNLYSKGFITAGMLSSDGRMDYKNRTYEISKLIDTNKARNEIALINVKDKTVKYGLDSLLAIIAYSYPFLNPLFKSGPFVFIFRKLYSFISLNRKVIICGKEPENPFACNPDFNLKYRLIYLLATTAITAYVLQLFTPLLAPLWPYGSDYQTEILIVTGQLLFQTLLLIPKEKNKVRILNYLGNVMTVSLFGSLLLLPAVVLHHFVPQTPPILFVVWFTGVVLVMLLEHNKRVNVHCLPGYLSYSWIIYRVLLMSCTYSYFIINRL